VEGWRGVKRGNMLHSRGRREPLRKLQAPHAVTTFSHVVRPPRQRGMTWSKVKSGAGERAWQYWHWKASRRNTLNRVNAGRRDVGTKSFNAMTLGSFIVMEGECTALSYSFSTETRSMNTALTASCQDHSDSGK